MDPITLLEQFGVPVAVAVAFGYFIWKQNKLQLEVKRMSASYEALVKIVTNLLKKR